MNGGENIESKELLKELAYKGLEKRGLSNNEEARNRLEHELSIILNSNLENFFLNTSYVSNLLKSKGIRLGPARGSAGGSITSYCLNITEINPLNYNLSFARFLNEERASHSMSDIDIDIPRDKRQESLNLIKQEFGKDKKRRESFDIATSRAVANMSVLVEYLLPLVKVGGHCRLLKGSQIEEELEQSQKALTVLGGKVEKLDYFELPLTDIKRTIVYLLKEKNTPSKYPRKPGMPAKDPIQ